MSNGLDEMLTADDIAKYLEDNELGTFGVDITAGNMPEKRNRCITVFDTGGSPSQQYFPQDTPSFSIMVRGPANEYADVRQLAQDCYQLLNRRQNLLINGKDVMLVAAIAPPQSIGTDDNGRQRFTLNITARVRRSDEQD